MKFSILIILALFHVSVSEADETKTLFRFAQPIEGELKEKSIGVVPITPEVFRETQPRFGDLRLMLKSDSGTEALPYLIVPREVRSAVLSTEIPAAVEQFERSGDDRLVVTVQLEDERKASRLRINNRLRDFEKNVRVEGSDDGESWSELVGESLIFDYARFIDFRRDAVELPENSYRYLRVTIEGATDRQLSLMSTLRREVSDSSGVTVETKRTVKQRDFKIEGLSFFTRAQEKEDEDSALRNYPLSLSDPVENEDLKRSEIVIESGNAPLTELILETDQSNFRRSVELQVPSGNEENSWRTIQKTEIFRYEIDDFKEERMRVPVAAGSEGLRAERLRLLIFQGDNRPVKLTGVKGEGRIHDLYFVMPAKGGLELEFGASGDVIGKPDYDVAAIRIGMRQKMARSIWTPGEVSANPDFVEAKEPFRWSDQRWILWIVIALIVAGLAWIIVGSAREIEEANIE
ncbi:MAG: DUF3999 family protein [Verrucomicrobiales bacterium]|nr:DUF3999 family protein [Verrucomicrobiales bacterium]